MKVLHSFYRSSQPSGENDTVRQQISLLSEHGFNVELIALSSDDFEGSPLAQPFIGLGLATGTPQASPPVAWLADADILHIHNTVPAISHEWICSIDIPKVLTAHNYRAFCANGLFLRNGFRCTDCVTHGSSQAVRHGCYRQSRLRTIPIALQQRSRRSLLHVMHTCHRVLLPGEPMRDIFSEYGVSNTQVIHNPVPRTVVKSASQPSLNEWLAVGRISNEKGLIDLLHLWPKSEALTVIGEGPDRETAEKIAAGRELKVRFLGTRDGSEIAQAMSESLGLIFSSKALEGAPLVYGEAMQEGLPVIAAEGSTLATQIKLDKTGFTFFWKDPASLANALEASRENRAAMSSRARQVYLNRYTPDVWIDKVTQVYQAAMSADQSM